MSATLLPEVETPADGRRPRDVAEILVELDRVAPELEAEIEVNEELGRLSDRTEELLREAGIPDLLTPYELGGTGAYPGEAVRVLERLAQIDGPIGWIGGNWSSSGVTIAHFSPEGAEYLRAEGPPLLVVAGAPSARAVPVEGGYRVSGKWSYGSGILQCDRVIVGAVVLGPDGAPEMTGSVPRVLSFAMSKEDTVGLGNWDTLGLRATGSIDFTVQDVFVPHERVANMFGPTVSGGPQLKGGFGVLLPLLHGSFALGAGRRLLDEIAALSQVPSSRGGSMSESPVFRTELARHEAELRSARAFTMERWDALDAALADGRPVTRRDEVLLRMALVHVHDVLRSVALFVFQRAMGTSLRAGRLQRQVRDALSGCQHLIVQDTIYPEVAKDLLGAPDDMTWTPLGLVQQG